MALWLNSVRVVQEQVASAELDAEHARTALADQQQTLAELEERCRAEEAMKATAQKEAASADKMARKEASEVSSLLEQVQSGKISLDDATAEVDAVLAALKAAQAQALGQSVPQSDSSSDSDSENMKPGGWIPKVGEDVLVRAATLAHCFTTARCIDRSNTTATECHLVHRHHWAICR